MATYLELFGLRDNSELLNRTAVAVVIAATAIKGETTPVTARVEWAQDALANPTRVARQALWVVLAENKSLSIATIQAAGDSALQSNVDGVVDLLAGSAAA